MPKRVNEMDKKTFLKRLVDLCDEAGVELCLFGGKASFAKNNHDSSDYLWMLPIDYVLEDSIDRIRNEGQQSVDGE